MQTYRTNPSSRCHCCCRLAAAIAAADATAKPSLLRHRVVTAVAAVLPQPLQQIQICAAAVAVTDVSLSPHCRPAIAAKTSLLRLCCCCIDVAAASLIPLPPSPVSQVCAATVAAISPLPFLLLTLLPSQVRSTNVLSQPLLPYCRSLCHKSIFAPLPSLSLPSNC